VLITGESGTGKEVVARAIHHAASSRRGPFVPVNCGALPEPLMESELFGHVKGAFTGAAGDKAGLVKSADGGTLFLDEIGELTLSLQVKLLRVIQEKTVRRVGGEKEDPVDVRFVCATNADLAREVEEGRFRTDLYYRLNVISIHIPPLRDRMEDLKPLINALLPAIAADNRSAVRGIHPEAMRPLLTHHYPGNVRELKNILERATAIASGDLVTIRDLPPFLQNGGQAANGHGGPRIPPEGIDLDETLRSVEEQYIRAALDTTGGVQAAAAKLLGISVRSLRYRLKLEKESSTDEEC